MWANHAYLNTSFNGPYFKADCDNKRQLAIITMATLKVNKRPSKFQFFAKCLKN